MKGKIFGRLVRILSFVTEWFHLYLQSEDYLFMELRRDVFQAIADPTRRDIINLLSNQSLNLNTVSGYYPISRPAISKHIKILSECGLIRITEQGRERYCTADLNKLKDVEQWLNQYRKFWDKKLDALGEFLERDGEE